MYLASNRKLAWETSRDPWSEVLLQVNRRKAAHAQTATAAARDFAKEIGLPLAIRKSHEWQMTLFRRKQGVYVYRPECPPEAEHINIVPWGGAKLTEAKDLYELGEIPPLGHVPAKMYAWAIRKERHGPPEEAMQLEVVPTWELDSHDVLVLVMAAGVNYNGVWAALGEPISVLDAHKQPFHIAGSDASGIVWAVGSKVKRWKVGDEVVVHCNQDDGDDEECNGGDPMFSSSQRIWGYETPDGSFAQFCRVQDRQLMERPKHLTWEESRLLHADACDRLSHAVRT